MRSGTRALEAAKRAIASLVGELDPRTFFESFAARAEMFQKVIKRAKRDTPWRKIPFSSFHYTTEYKYSYVLRTCTCTTVDANNNGMYSKRIARPWPGSLFPSSDRTSG